MTSRQIFNIPRAKSSICTRSQKLYTCFLGLSLFLVACSNIEVQPKSTAPTSDVRLIQKLVDNALSKEKFDLVYYPPGANPNKVVDSIVEAIKQAGSRGLFIVIGSEDLSIQKEVIHGVCSNFAPEKLVGSKIAVIGLKEDSAEFEAQVRKTGAEFIFIEFRKLP